MLRWTERAVNDLIEIGEYIAAENPTAARARLEELRQRAVKASKMPRTGRVVPEIGRRDVREVFLRTSALSIGSSTTASWCSRCSRDTASWAGSTPTRAERDWRASLSRTIGLPE
jgi:plasmid stabilization system protein ParE